MKGKTPRMLAGALPAVVLASSAIACSSPGAASDAGTGDVPASGPYLTELSVSSTSSANVTLVPHFAGDIYDYYVQCGAGPNELTVSMAASPGATSALRQPTSSASASRQTLPVEVEENQAIVATVIGETSTTEYWVRCLPHDFPAMTWAPHAEVGTAPPGYYLLGTARSAPGASGYAIVLNGHGVPVWYYNTGKYGPAVIDNVVAGAISFFMQPGAAATIHHLSPLKTDYVAPRSTVFDPHELQVLPNGNYVGLSNPPTTADLTGLRVPLPDGGTGSTGKNTSIGACNLVEFEPSGKVVWTWVGADHFDPVKDSTSPQLDLPHLPDGGEVIDTYHCNSIDIDPANGGNLLVSSRDMDSLFYIDRASSKILWKMGGKTFTKEGAPYIKVDDPFYRQHDARLRPGWSTCTGGQITLFDDHSYVHGSARGIVLDVSLGSAGASGDCKTQDAGTAGASVSWQYGDAGDSRDRGSFRISTDGSRVIGWGTGARLALVFSEVDERGHDLLDFYFSGDDVSYRAIKVPLSAFDLGVLRATAGIAN